MTDLTTLSNTLRGLLGSGFGIGVTDPRAPSDPLWDAEKPSMTRAVPKRILEFTAGRTAARAAMANLGISPAAIPMAPDRAPIWPDEIMGSIAHCNTACIAIVARKSATQSVGIDVEETTPLSDDLWVEVCTPAELKWLRTQPKGQQGVLAKQIFIAKEATYKAQYPLTRRMIGFEEVDILFGDTEFSAQFNTTRYTGQFVEISKLLVAIIKH